MLRSLHVIALIALLAACGGSQDAASTSPEAPVASEPAGADTPVASEPAAAVGCEQEIALECGAGMKDGCLTAVTTHHACVAESAAAGPPCEQEIAAVCDAGMVDGCLATPPVAATHVCVKAP